MNEILYFAFAIVSPIIHDRVAFPCPPNHTAIRDPHPAILVVVRGVQVQIEN